MDLLDQPFFWGLTGSLWYALPKILSCVVDHPEKWRSCSAELVISLIIGASVAAVAGPAVALYLHVTEVAYIRAMCTGLGLAANKAAPLAQDLIIQALERWARGKAE